MADAMYPLDKYYGGVVEIPEHLSKDDMRMVREWIEKQPHLPPVSDMQIYNFLNRCQNSVEKAKRKIESYYAVRSAYYDPMLINRKPSEISALILNKYTVMVIPELDAEGNVLIMGKLTECGKKAENFDFNDLMRTLYAVTDLCTYHYPFARGYKFCYDLSGIGLGQVKNIAMKLKTLRAAVLFCQDGFPVRMTGLYFFNGPAVASHILKLIQPFAKSKLFDRIKATDSVAKLETFVSKKYLPKDYGGDQASVHDLSKNTREIIEKYGGFFEDDDEFGKADESERITANPFGTGEAFGAEGTFRKFNID